MPAKPHAYDEALVSANDSILGKLLDGRYQVISRLNQDRFVATYRAQDIRRPSHPNCVVKQLQCVGNFESANLDEVRRSLENKAAILEKLGHHDRIPQLLAHFEENQAFYLVQELIEGHPLSVELAGSAAASGQRMDSPMVNAHWTEAQVIHLLQEILTILDYAHAQGVVHQDLKSENVIRRHRDQQLVLIGFETRLIGNEQIQAQPCPDYDIYALGIIGIQALTGIPPQQLKGELQVEKVLRSQQPQVSNELVAVLVKMTSPYASDRYQTVPEVQQALQQLVRVRMVEAITLSSNQPSASTLAPLQYISADTALALQLPQQSAVTITTHTKSFRRASLRHRSAISGRTQSLTTSKVISLLTGMGLISAGIFIFFNLLFGTGSWRSHPEVDSSANATSYDFGF
jgi:serine/threonine-protein kinase